MNNTGHEVKNRISEAIWELEQQYSIGEIAKKIGCSRRALYNYRDMNTTMSLQHFKGLCDLTGKSADFFIYGKE